MRCDKCKYWDTSEWTIESGRGNCHRNAPVVHASSVFDSVKAQWPSTKMFNWCGEFVTKYE